MAQRPSTNLHKTHRWSPSYGAVPPRCKASTATAAASSRWSTASTCCWGGPCGVGLGGLGWVMAPLIPAEVVEQRAVTPICRYRWGVCLCHACASLCVFSRCVSFDEKSFQLVTAERKIFRSRNPRSQSEQSAVEFRKEESRVDCKMTKTKGFKMGFEKHGSDSASLTWVLTQFFHLFPMNFS